MAPDGIVKLKDIGQIHPLRVAIRNFLEGYRRNVGILKEAIQNADDGEASRVEIVLDRRSYAGPEEMNPLLGPALLIFNDRPFRDEDFHNIRQLGNSDKLHEEARTGRFGRGFTSFFNVTDYPSLLSRSTFIVFDPHERLPGSAGEAALGYELTGGLWNQHPHLLRPFEAAGLHPGQLSFDGTIFRLPFRAASGSEICDELFTEDECRRLFVQLEDVAEDLLLFLKHVSSVSVDEIDPGGEKRRLISIRTVNSGQVDEARQRLRGAIAHHAKQPSAHGTFSYLHEIEVHGRRAHPRTLWRVVTGLYDAPDLASAGEALRQRSKALPWAAAAARLAVSQDGSIEARPIRGLTYCSLPLGSDVSGLPVHVHGFFDIEPTRQSLTDDASTFGAAAARTQWNRAMVEYAVAPAYAELLANVANDITGNDLESYYRLFPPGGEALVGPLRLLPAATYRRLAKERVIRCVGEHAPWAKLSDLRPPPPEWAPRLQEPLRARRMSIPDPLLPPEILKGFKEAKVAIGFLTPGELRRSLRVKHDVNTSLAQAPDEALRRREWVVELLKFCRSDLKETSRGNELVGLPLALLADRKLHTFGVNRIYLGGPDERALIPQPSWFLDVQFHEETKLKASPAAHLVEMTPTSVIEGLKVVVGERSKSAPSSWSPEAPHPPNEPWLTRLFKYLTERIQKLSAEEVATLRSLALVPDAERRLHRGGQATTPLLLDEAQLANQALRRALDAFQVPVVDGGEPLLKAIRDFVQKHPSTLVWWLNGPVLAAALGANLSVCLQRAGQGYAPEVYDPILEVLATTRQMGSYTPAQERLLKRLPLFPTIHGKVVSLEGPRIFLPPEQPPPPAPGEVTLLKAEPNVRALLSKLGVKRLKTDVLVMEVLLPAYPNLSSTEQVKVLRWIRSHRKRARQDAEDTSPEQARALDDALSDGLLVRGDDGTLHAACELYRPNERMVAECLGPLASSPDVIHTYSEEQEEWLAFFTALGMQREPRPQDLIARVDQLVAQAAEQGTAAVTDDLVRIYRHLDDYWPELATQTVRDEDGNPITMAQAFSERRWLPAQRNPKVLARYAGAMIPEERLYAPSELFPPSQGHELASQRPIAAVKEPTRELRQALGMPIRAGLDTVIAHFDYFLARSEEGSLGDIPAKPLQDALTAIYSRFGGLAGPAEAGEEDPPAEGPTIDERQRLRERYRDRECLWDPAAQKLWRPRDAFRKLGRLFPPYRAQLKGQTPQVDEGYNVLGRRDSPDAGDYLALLEDVAAANPSEPLPGDVVPNVIEVLRQLTLLFPGTMPDPDRRRLRVLTTENMLVPASEAYRNDAPWYAEKLASGHVALVHPEVPPDLLRVAGVERLSRNIVETLSEVPERATEASFIACCEAWGRTLRSKELSQGLRRLIRAKHETGARPGSLTWLESTTLFPAARLESEFSIGRHRGRSETSSHFLPERNTLYLAEQNLRIAALALAQAINVQLADDRLDDTAPLVVILQCEPGEIDGTLTVLKVPPVEAETSPEDWRLPPSEEPVPPASDEPANVVAPDAEPIFEEPAEREPEMSPVAPEPAGNGVANEIRSFPPRRPGTIPVAPSGGPRVGGPARPPEPRPLDDAPPIQPGHGHSTHEAPGSSRAPASYRAVTYVSPAPPAEPQPRGPERGEQNENREIARAAVARVMELERAEQRNPTELPHNNPGYDVESRDGDDIRYIEVKGTAGSWPVAGVAVSDSQFNKAWTEGERYWLYVVEYALDDERARIHRIQNPTGAITEYRFDPGWRALGEGDTAPLRPEKGRRVRLPNGMVDEILAVEGADQVLLMQLRDHPERIPFEPGTMVVLSEEK